MALVNRRGFLAWCTAIIPAGFLVRRLEVASAGWLVDDRRTLTALGHTVLPDELGAETIDGAVREFQEWIDGYREGAELVHGYGTSRLQFAAPTPATRWTGQLDALDAAAKRRSGDSFADAPVAARRALVSEAIEAGGDRLDRIPSVAQARHVAVALIAHFYASPSAVNACYQVEINPRSCRPLAGSASKPRSMG